VRLEFVDRNPKGPGCVKKAAIINRNRDALSLCSEKLYRCQMEGIEGADWLGKRLQSSGEHRRREFDQRNAASKERTSSACVPVSLRA
jgi:hypothetical protein